MKGRKKVITGIEQGGVLFKMNVEDRRERDNIRNHSEKIMHALHRDLLEDEKDYFDNKGNNNYRKSPVGD